MSIFGIGNPLLDIQATVDEATLKEIGLKPNDAILAEPRHMEIFTRLENTPGVEYVAGGSSQNALRVARWCLDRRGKMLSRCSFVGAVGHDERGEKMETVCKAAGVDCFYQLVQGYPTGTCAICITNSGRSRSLVANVGAAEKFDLSHFEKSKSEMINSHEIFYCEGYFICSCPEAVKSLARSAHRDGKLFALNISAPFIAQVEAYREVLIECLPFTGLLFGNDAEAIALGLAMGWGDDVMKISRILAEYRAEAGINRVVVITQGSDPTIMCRSGEIEVQQVPIIPVDNLVDTNGAGDAYVGGFLAGLSCGDALLDCCRLGAEAASIVIQRSGCTLPPL